MKRQPANHQQIIDVLKAKVFPSIHDAQDDLADILQDYELSAPLIRGLVGAQKEIAKAEKSLISSLAVASFELEANSP